MKILVARQDRTAVTQYRGKQTSRDRTALGRKTHYALLGLHPSASPLEIRRAYRELSKRYHPDTTELSTEVATVKFQQLNEAYGTLSNPERRAVYDRQIGYSRFNVIQAPPGLETPTSRQPPRYSSSAYLDPTDRPLSAGELFALFILGIAFLGCLLLAIVIGLTRGEAAFQVSQTANGNSLLHQRSAPPQTLSIPSKLQEEVQWEAPSRFK